MDRALYEKALETLVNMKNIEGMRGYYNGKLDEKSVEKLILSTDFLLLVVKKMKAEYEKELKSLGVTHVK